ncbi:MAG: hypothetical protein KDJ14_08760 [Xanthomonadales bacterium]|nr:hypothetical protein [Xanthomonadales bacterium]
MSAVLSVVREGENKSSELDPKTPLLGALEVKLDSGLTLISAVRELMLQAGLLKGGGGPAKNDPIGQALARLRDAGLIVMEPGEKNVRLTTLGDPADPIALKLDASAQRDVERGSAALSLSAKAKLELILDVLDRDEAAEIGLPLAAPDVLHRCHFGGNLGLGGGLKAPVFSADAAMGLGAGITWYFERHRHDTVVGSLVDAGFELSSGGARPWVLEDVRSVLAHPAQPGRHLDALRAIDIEAERSMSVSGKLSLQRGFIREASVKGASGPESIKLSAVAKASFGFSASRKGAFNLRLTLDGNDVLLDLTRKQSSTRGREFSAGIDIGIDGLDSLAQGWIDKILPEIDSDLRGKLEQWSRPGGNFVAKLKDKLGKKWGERLLPLAELALGEVSAEDAAEALSAQLIDRWAAMLDERIDLLEGDASDAAIRLLDAVSEDPRYAEIKAQVQSSLAKAIEALRSDIDEEIADYVANLKGKSKKKLTALLSPLEAFGDTVQDLVAKVDDSAKDVVDRIKQLLAKYEAWRKRLTDAAQKAAALKLSVNFAASSSYETGQSRQLMLRFTPNANKQAKDLFQRIVLGQGAIALDRIEALEAAGAGVHVEEGGFSAYAKRARSVSLSLDLFGLTFSDTRVLTSEVAIDVDAAGRVLAFAGKARQTDVSDNSRSTQSATFSADFDLLATPAEPGQLPGTLALGFELVSKGKVTRKELGEFLESFVEVGLLDEDEVAEVAAKLKDKSNSPLSISVALAGMGALMQRAARADSLESLQGEVLQNWLRLARYQRGDVRDLLQKVPFQPLLGWALRASSTTAAQRVTGETLESDPNLALLVKSRGAGDNLREIATEYIALHQMVTSIPLAVRTLGKIGELAATTQSATLSDEAAIEARNRFDALLQSLQDAAEPVTDVSDAICRRLVSERLPDRTLALLATLARLGAGTEFGAKVSMRRVSFNKQGQRVLGELVEF